MRIFFKKFKHQRLFVVLALVGVMFFAPAFALAAVPGFTPDESSYGSYLGTDRLIYDSDPKLVIEDNYGDNNVVYQGTVVGSFGSNTGKFTLAQGRDGTQFISYHNDLLTVLSSMTLTQLEFEIAISGSESTSSLVPSSLEPGAGEALESINAADDINVKLQIPLPFVRTGPTAENLECEAGKVCNLTEYIKGVYRLLIGLGALFAVVMMIIAGYQWMFSGGSADKTGAAKKRIFNAWIGLILALLSYVILNAITPRLVALRLPKVDPVQRLEINVDESCQTIFTKKDNLYINSYFNKFKRLDFSAKRFAEETERAVDAAVERLPDAEETACGIEYDVYGDLDPNAKELDHSKNIAQCKGGLCEGTNICISGRCVDAFVYGNITNKLELTSGYVTAIDVFRVCKVTGILVFDNLSLIPLDSKSFSGQPSIYRIPRPEEIIDDCFVGEHLGYAIRVMVDDGYLGLDNSYLVGKNCSSALIKTAGDLLSVGRLEDIPPGFSGTIPVDSATTNDLIQKEQLEGGFQCDIDLTNDDFADYD